MAEPKTKKTRSAKTVVITGANGRLGRVISKELLNKGFNVRGIVAANNQINKLPAGTIPYVGDITDKEMLHQACDGADAIFHFAAIVSQRRLGPKEIVRVNANGTASVLEAAEKNDVRKFIFSSTVDVYGSNRKDVLTEDSELRPSDMYGQSKVLAEHQITEFSKSVSYTIFRTATLYGPGFEDSFFKILRAIKKQKAYIIGSGQNKLSLIHIDDMARAMFLACENDKSDDKIYNLSDGKHYPQEELFKIGAEMLHVPPPTKHINTTIFKLFAKQTGLNVDELRFITSNRLIDISRIRKELDFVPKVQIRAAAKELAEEFLSRYKNVG